MDGSYRKLLEYCLESVFDGSDIDGGSFQDKAEELGLIVKVVIPQEKIDADPDKYAACLEYETNELYFPYWTDEAKHALIFAEGKMRKE